MNTSDLQLVTDSQDLEAVMDSVGVKAKYRADITGALVEVGEGEYTRAYFTESNAPYSIYAKFRPVSYYRK